METELQSVKPDPEPTNHHNSSSNHHQTEPNRDDRPLLKSDSNNNNNNNHQNSSTTGETMEELEKKYAAYVRHDVYGPMGRGELPVAEKLRLGIAVATLVPIRIAIGLGIIVLYYVICRVCTVFWRAEESGAGAGEEEAEEGFAHIGGWRRSVIVASGRFLSRALLFVVGFYWINECYRDADGHQHHYKNSTQVLWRGVSCRVEHWLELFANV